MSPENIDYRFSLNAIYDELAKGRIDVLPKKLEPGEETVVWYLPDAVAAADGLVSEEVGPGKYDRILRARVRVGGKRIKVEQLEKQLDEQPIRHDIPAHAHIDD